LYSFDVGDAAQAAKLPAEAWRHKNENKNAEALWLAPEEFLMEVDVVGAETRASYRSCVKENFRRTEGRALGARRGC
jgi:hypothetical protein